ncbi:hypothetical protein JCM10207_005374 [Rhodosporidiobolus poonsookiae]
MPSSSSAPQSRLAALSSSLASSPRSPAAAHHAPRVLLGHLKADDVRLPVYEPADSQRLPSAREGVTLDGEDEVVMREMRWCMQKWELKQDLFLLSSPGPFTRRLALTFLALLNQPYEYVALHRDVGETEIKQGREIRKGGRLEYTDSAAVRAMKEGKVLILDGIERCERGVLPLLNNALENREMNLEDGTHIVSSARYDLMVRNGDDTTGFVPCHPDFRVIALGCPVPPYPGLPIDPPFRSRFQARYLDPVEASKVMARQELRRLRENGGKSEDEVGRVEEVVRRVGEVVEVVQVKREMQAKMASGISTDTAADIPLFPQTALLRLVRFLSVFPPPQDPLTVTPAQFYGLLLTLHPTLAHASPAARRALEGALKDAGFPPSWYEGLGELDYPTEAAKSEDGIFGWRLQEIKPSGKDDRTALLTFRRDGCKDVTVPVAAGPLPFAAFPPSSTDDLHITPRFTHLLTSLFQLHALSSFDISFVPSLPQTSSSSGSTSLVLTTFASFLGYDLEALHLYKELSGRELWMRRVTNGSFAAAGGEGGEGGTTGWEPSALVQGAKDGRLVWLEGVDTLGPTLASLGRLFSDREGELWEGRRLTLGSAAEAGTSDGLLDFIHPSFRIITTSTHASPPSYWLTESLSASLAALPSLPMPPSEERALLLSTGCPPPLVDALEAFALRYREVTAVEGSKARRLGTASLVRIGRRLARFPGESVRTLLERTLLTEFLPATEREQVRGLMEDVGLREEELKFYPPVVVGESSLTFTTPGEEGERAIPLFDQQASDPAGAPHVPFMESYHDNSQQTRLMLDIATDLTLLDQHVLLLGPQGSGKNKIVDRLLMLLRRPREYIQLHRDSTTTSLLFQVALEGGVVRYNESPLLKAVRYGRAIVIDEVDKAPPPVVAALASLASRGEMSLPDGRRIRPASRPSAASSETDILVHPNFRLILLANRPGFPFLGNPFLQVLGDTFSCYAVVNPDGESELRVLQQLAPELDEELLSKLVRAFQDLRVEFDKGTLSYPFSLRELLSLTRHLRRFPTEPLTQALRSIFDFDVHSAATLDSLRDVLRKHRLGVDRVGIDAVRGEGGEGLAEGKEKAKVIEYEPKGSTELSGPKEGKHDDKEHSGGNTWAGGTGGRDTAGLGGRGGYKRLYKGGNIKQVSSALKADVPDEIKDRARDMARQELAEKLKQLDMTSGQASIYSRYHDAVAAHVHQLTAFFENLEAKEEERIWLKRQIDGELDESRLSEGLTGEATVYKRRGTEKPDLGQPQLKPKRIRFVFDVSASMYRNQFDGRLARSLEAALMIMESFDRLSSAGKQKYDLDITGHSGEDAEIVLVERGKLPNNAGDLFKVIEKMSMVSQYCWPGDETIHALEKSIDHVAEADADDNIVIAISDANFERYNITAEDIRRALNRNSKVRTSLVAIGEGAESEWLPRALPGKAWRVRETSDIARTLRAILGQQLGGL